MDATHDEVQISKLEAVLAVGIVGCMLFATWELAHLLADEWLDTWVRANIFWRKRLIYYGIAFLMAGAFLLLAVNFGVEGSRFVRTVTRAFLWYGVLLLISTIAAFVFDCLPEVMAGFVGAGLFVAAIYVLQKRFYTRDRIVRMRLEKGKCFSCGYTLHSAAVYCAQCGTQVGKKCPSCGTLLKLHDMFCCNCGNATADTSKNE